MKTTHLNIKGMSCGHCVAAVTQALKSIQGVQNAEVSLTEGSATISHSDSVDTSSLIAAVEEEGYEAEVR